MKRLITFQQQAVVVKLSSVSNRYLGNCVGEVDTFFGARITFNDRCIRVPTEYDQSPGCLTFGSVPSTVM